ncbi:caveolin-2-like [Osmerus eperlanus]|uniref:caveolin-2-like n=1 Tax=Osmerus eperlanus TaxID=29151 RepID=UPI002E0F04DE
MTTGGTPAQIRLSLEDIEEQEESPLWVPPSRIPLERPPEKASTDQVEVEVEVEEEEESVSITQSDTRPLVQSRDPKGVNKCLKVRFEDVIAEPPSVRSFDKVWLGSHALFEVSRLWFYRLISLVLAGPVSLVAGILFALLSFIHIWLILPCVQVFLIHMHWVQTVWASLLNIAIGPLFNSMGKCCASINIRVAKD